VEIWEKQVMLDGLKNTILIGLMIINLSGCVGYYESRSSTPVEKDMTLALLVVPQDVRERWKKEKPKILKQSKFINDDRALPLGTLSIGQKDQIKDRMIKETRIYNDKTRWCGRTAWAIIPIPLLKKSCRTYTEINFENGEPVSAQEQYLEKAMHVCGPFVPFVKESEGFCLDIKGVE
jgi:hypothetical protein